MNKNFNHIQRAAIALLIMMLTAATAWAQWTGDGDGSSDNPYKISSYAQLKEFASIVNSTNSGAWAILTHDIVCKNSFNDDNYATDWTPIGNASSKYTGTFDGRGNTITGLSTDADNLANNVGLFGYVGGGGTVKNVILEDAKITGYTYVGGVVGVSGSGCLIENAVVSNSVISGQSHVGGIGGYNAGTVKTSCFVGLSSVGGNSPDKCNHGGIAGTNVSLIEDSYVAISGSISATAVNGGSVGGIVGENGSSATIKNCHYSGSGNISGNNTASGNLSIGGISGNNEGSVQYCYHAGTGEITATAQSSNIGAIIGANKNSATAQNCYYNKDNTTVTNAIGNANDTDNVKGLTADQFKDITNFSGFSTDDWIQGVIAPLLKGVRYTISFKANGGEDYMDDQTVTSDNSAALSANSFTRDNYQFTGWNTKADGSGTSIAADTEARLVGPETLYAQWTRISGICGHTNVNNGKNVIWCYNLETKTLTISGTGAMNNYSGNNQPWKDYMSDITTAVIEEGVTSISNRFLYGCTALTSVTIGSSVTTIGASAFNGCTALTSVTIGSSVTTIGASAFYGCTSLATISGTAGVTTIESSAFDDTAWYNGLPDGLTTVGHVAYRFKGDGTSVTLPDGTTQIYNGAFGYTAITSIIIPASVTSIGDRALASSALLKVYCLASEPPALSAYSFDESLPAIVVPAAAYELYKKRWYSYSDYLQHSYSDYLQPGYTVSCGEGITATSFAPIVAEGETVTLSYTGSATIPAGYHPVFSYNDGTNNIAIDGAEFLMPAANVTVSVDTDHPRSTGQPVSVSYVLADGTAKTTNAIAIDGTEPSIGTKDTETWYYVGTDISHNGELICYGNVNIILGDGKTMNIDAASDTYALYVDWYFPDTYKGQLTVYGQSGQTGMLGAYGSSYGIINSSGTIIINGGIVNASGTEYGVNALTVTINGGNVSGKDGRGIYGSTFKINGGNVSAGDIYGHQIDINGGNVSATKISCITENNGYVSLGWRNYTDRIFANSYEGNIKVAKDKMLSDGSGNFFSDTVTDLTAINGKTLQPAVVTSYVEANGIPHTNVPAVSLDATMTTLAAGTYVVDRNVDYTNKVTLTGDATLILGDGKTMTVTNTGDDCCITATGYSLNIYGQTEGTGTLSAQTYGKTYEVINIKDGTLAIHGGTVKATVAGSEAYSTAIVVQRHAADGDALIIDGGTLNANGNNGYAIYLNGGSSRIDGGQVTATGARSGIRVQGYDNVTQSISIPGTLTLGGGTLTATNFHTYSGQANEGTIAVANGKIYTDGTVIYDGTTTTATLAALTDVTLYPCLQLADNADNTTAIAAAGNCRAVILKDRTLYKDGKWNTLCLPFGVTAAQMAESTHPLYGSTIMELDATGTYDTNKQTGFDASTGTLYLYFNDATSIEAGKPYIVKWSSGQNLVSPVFSGITVSNTPAATVEANNSGLNTVQFIGTYSPVTLTPRDKSNLFLGTSTDDQNQTVSTLYYPDAANNDDGYYHINACRAFFHVDLTGTPNGVRAFSLNFGNGSETESQGISDALRLNDKGEMINDKEAGAWYTLDGRNLDKMPTRKGLYINNGKKVVIK